MFRKTRRAASYHCERAAQERERAYAAHCRQAMEAHLRLAELHNHERALAMYQDHIEAIRAAELKHRLHADDNGLALTRERVD